MKKVFTVVADHAEFSDSFCTYHEAYTWLRMVRMTFGCNAALITKEIPHD